MEAENAASLKTLCAFLKTKQSYCLTQRLHLLAVDPAERKAGAWTDSAPAAHSGGRKQPGAAADGSPTAVVCTQERMWLQLGWEDALASAAREP